MTEQINQTETLTTEIITTADPKQELPQVRAMTRKQFRAMKDAGFNVLDADDETKVDKTLDMFEWILDNIYSDYDLDDYPNGDCLKLAADTFRLAMGQPTEEAKNS